MKRTIALGALVLVIGACAGGEKKTGPEPVTVGAWCEGVGKATCSNTGDKCFAGMSGFEEGCIDSFMTQCTGGNANKMTKRTHDDLNACVDFVDSRTCEQLGSDTGEAMVGAGRYAQLCKLDAGS